MSEKTPREQIALLKNVIEDLQERVQTASEALNAIIIKVIDKHHEEGIAHPVFERIYHTSNQHAYQEHPAVRSSMPELYYVLLLSILTVADATEAQWFHIYRVAAGAGYKGDVRDLLPAAYSLTEMQLIESINSIQRDDLTNAFLLDSILLALLHEETSPVLLSYIAGLFTLLNAPKEAVHEAILIAKNIVEQNCEAYLETMIKAKHLHAHESCCYLFHLDGKNIVSNLVQAESTESEHLTVLCLNEQNVNLDLDMWKAERITFRNCIFENSTIKTSQKEVSFVECLFEEKIPNTGNTHLHAEKLSTFKKCTFQNIASEACMLSLYNATILHCIFSDCSVRNYDSNTPLIELSSSTLTDSKFIRCYCKGGFIGCAEGRLFHIEKTTIMRCKFSHCIIHIDGTGSIIYAHDSSTIEDCRFKKCIIDNGSLNFKCIIYLYGGREINNAFHNCSCDQYVF